MWTEYTCFGCDCQSPSGETSKEVDVVAFKSGWQIGHADGEGRYICPDCEDSVFDPIPLYPTRMRVREAESLLAKRSEESGSTVRLCPSCNGNDKDAPCAHQSEGRDGCLRDERLADEGRASANDLCHMIADTDAELRLMAEQIGVQQKWH